MPIDPLIAARTRRVDPDVAFRPQACEPAAVPEVRRTPIEATAPAFDVAPESGEITVVESIEDAYRRLYPSLVRLAFLLVDTQELAEEAVQEAFTRAWPKWNRVQHADAYLRTCVVNACRKVQRRRRVVRRTPDPYLEYGELGADHVSDVVRRLRSPMREAIVLRYYLQMSEAQIAATLGIAPGTVKSTLHRARALLKEELS